MNYTKQNLNKRLRDKRKTTIKKGLYVFCEVFALFLIFFISYVSLIVFS